MICYYYLFCLDWILSYLLAQKKCIPGSSLPRLWDSHFFLRILFVAYGIEKSRSGCQGCSLPLGCHSFRSSLWTELRHTHTPLLYLFLYLHSQNPWVHPNPSNSNTFNSNKLNSIFFPFHVCNFLLWQWEIWLLDWIIWERREGGKKDAIITLIYIDIKLAINFFSSEFFNS